ncbi:protein ALTERED PHOSPHATE STARVATION RESPONSE 1 [Rhodamnia argentea]|uniref:Protein ALTERED PHOSPHATE STARVATION RESPONSE 1 n=1 Tax=Rhodamnia argentea TaxID=178133 RepID=A0A8B8MN67_9MYRT|nr:protein ALTERED PHOSPHATE STARVATION RESPONSE 1 [Rhodamnia argentea]
MGCVLSRIDEEERVRVCKERKRLMKQLLVFRGDFADALLTYLRALKNTGATLRQFTESESLEIENTSYGLASPPSPPPPLPPSPPPPPVFSPDIRRPNKSKEEITSKEESIEINEHFICTPPPPPIPCSSWNSWDPFETSLPLHERKSKVVMEANDDKNWVESKMEFEGEEGIEETLERGTVDLLPKKEQPVEFVDDTSSQMSWNTKESADMTREVWKSKKSLEGIVKNLDEYFLEASALVGDIAIFVDVNSWDSFPPERTKEHKRKRSNSAKVVSALSWNWSSKSLQLIRDAAECPGPSEPCMPGAHQITLEKLFTAEHELYKHLKEEETAKLEYERKLLLLQKQEDENHDWSKTDKTRSTVEGLESDLVILQQSISRTCAVLLTTIDEELHPQLVALTSGLMHMWRTMYRCHKVQNHIALQLNHISVNQVTELSSDFHRQAAVQLEAEVESWYNSFCKLVISQKGYVRTLYRWLQLTDCLADDQLQSNFSSALRILCEDWQLHLDRVPDKAASEAIKSLLLGVRSILLQQAEELDLQKKAKKLEKKLQKESSSLDEMEKKVKRGLSADNPTMELGPNHPLSLKRAKIEALKKWVDNENTKCVNLVEVTKAMALNHLKNSLPRIFQALMEFSSAYARAFEALNNHGEQVDTHVDELRVPA